MSISKTKTVHHSILDRRIPSRFPHLVIGFLYWKDIPSVSPSNSPNSLHHHRRKFKKPLGRTFRLFMPARQHQNKLSTSSTMRPNPIVLSLASIGISKEELVCASEE